eukprot:4654971-Alexandrium_andersonii.AAC.1
MPHGHERSGIGAGSCCCDAGDATRLLMTLSLARSFTSCLSAGDNAEYSAANSCLRSRRSGLLAGKRFSSGLRFSA